MTDAPFMSARAKLARASVHIDDFIARGLAWAETVNRTYLAAVERAPDRFEGDVEVIAYRLTTSNHPDPPADFGAIVGDALVNFRAVLDHIAWELVRWTGVPARREEDICFPVSRSDQRFTADCARKLPNVAAKQIAIVRQFQPLTVPEHLRDDYPFVVLNWLVNIDKHRQLTVVSPHPSVLASASTATTWDNFALDHVDYAEPDHDPQIGDDLLRVYGRRIDPSRPNGVLVMWRETGSLRIEARYPVELVFAELKLKMTDLLDQLSAEAGTR